MEGRGWETDPIFPPTNIVVLLHLIRQLPLLIPLNRRPIPMINLETAIRPPILRRLGIQSDLIKRGFDLMIRIKVAIILYLLAQGVTVVETPFREVGTPVAGEGGLARFGVLGEVLEDPACDVVFGFHGGVEGLACGDGFVVFGVGGWGIGGGVDGGGIECSGDMVYGCVLEVGRVGEVRE